MDFRPRKNLFLLPHCYYFLFKTADCRPRTFLSSSLPPLPYSVQLFSPGLGGHRADQGEGRRSDLAFARWRGSRVKPRRSGLKRLLRPSGTGEEDGAATSAVRRYRASLDYKQRCRTVRHRAHRLPPCGGTPIKGQTGEVRGVATTARVWAAPAKTCNTDRPKRRMSPPCVSRHRPIRSPCCLQSPPDRRFSAPNIGRVYEQ